MFDIKWIVNNYNIWTKPCFLNWIKLIPIRVGSFLKKLNRNFKNLFRTSLVKNMDWLVRKRKFHQWFVWCVVQSLEQLDLEETKKDLINREIRSFRDAHKVGVR